MVNLAGDGYISIHLILFRVQIYLNEPNRHLGNDWRQEECLASLRIHSDSRAWLLFVASSNVLIPTHSAESRHRVIQYAQVRMQRKDSATIIIFIYFFKYSGMRKNPPHASRVRFCSLVSKGPVNQLFLFYGHLSASTVSVLWVADPCSISFGSTPTAVYDLTCSLGSLRLTAQ